MKRIKSAMFLIIKIYLMLNDFWLYHFPLRKSIITFNNNVISNMPLYHIYQMQQLKYIANYCLYYATYFIHILNGSFTHIHSFFKAFHLFILC